jgi:hypothetical protein
MDKLMVVATRVLSLCAVWYWAKLPENPVSSVLSGQNGTYSTWTVAIYILPPPRKADGA